MLSKDFPHYRHVWYSFNKWSRDGTWACLNTKLRCAVRQAAGQEPEPSATILDSPSVKTTESGDERGLDAHKKVKGRKRHVLVDTLGLLLIVVVSAASVQNSEGDKRLLEAIANAFPHLQKVWADEGYKPWLVEWVQRTCGFVLEIIRKVEGQVGLQVLPQRWQGERSLAWFNRNQRLRKDYEHHTQNSERMVYLASIRLMLRRLTATAG